jgi:hypothetical protein
MGRSGVINKQFTGEENEAYHDIIALFKIYRSVNWRMQVKVNQVKHRIQWEYGTDIDTFLDSVYQAGMDINQDLGDMKERIEVINRSNKSLKLIDEAVELMRKFHPQAIRRPSAGGAAVLGSLLQLYVGLPGGEYRRDPGQAGASFPKDYAYPPGNLFPVARAGI